jgi:glycosyltransferase involved in cell wall biosynthesis
MRVAVFLSNSHLGHWSWLAFAEGKVPASGTDGQIIALAQRLSRRDDIALLAIFGGALPDDAPPGAELVEDLSGAAACAAAQHADLLLFIDRANAETRAGIAACEAVGVRAVVWAQNGPYAEDRTLFATSAAVRRVVCVSAPHADLLRHLPIFEKVVVINNSLLARPKLAAPERDPNAVCFLGATVREKGFHLLVAAWPTVRRVVPLATLTVFGSANLYDRHNATGPLGLGVRDFEAEYITPVWGADRARLHEELGVNLAGLTTPAELGVLLRSFAVAVVNPWASRTGSVETFCVSAVEAAAAGCAVIGGRRLGLTETVRNGKTGVLIRHEKKLASALIALLENPARVAAFGRCGEEWAPARFSAERADTAWLALFREVAADQRARPPRIAFRTITTRTIARQGVGVVRRTSVRTRRISSRRAASATAR